LENVLKFIKNLFKAEQVKAFGLDIGSESVKLVQLSQLESGQFSVVNIALKNIEPLDEEKAENVDGSLNIIKAITSCVNSVDVDTEYAICSVRGPEVAVRNFKFPKMPQNELYQAILLEAEQVCPFDINQSVVDYQILPSTNGKIPGIFVAATANVVSQQSRLVRKSSLKPVMMDAEALAILNCYEHCCQHGQDETVGIIDIGKKYTTMIVVGHDELPFVRDLDVNGESMIRKIADSTAIDIEQVKQIISQQKLEADEILSSALNSCSQELIDDIAETNRYYMSNYSKKVDRILLCGGYACIKGLDSIISSRLGCGVSLWNPLDKIVINNPAINAEKYRKMGPSMTVALGLAMRKVY
jgi:type IV pilus assembly protein PilM